MVFLPVPGVCIGVCKESSSGDMRAVGDGWLIHSYEGTSDGDMILPSEYKS